MGSRATSPAARRSTPACRSSCRSTAAIPRRPSTPTRAERALAERGATAPPPMALADRRSFREGIERMTASWVWELQNHIEQRIPDPVDYIEMRRNTFGSDLTMNLARVTHSGDLPPELFLSRPMVELENSAQDYACLLNDVFSYQKE